MNLQKIEDEALHLPKEELRSDWLLEARRGGE
jgi:hypothetical protein